MAGAAGATGAAGSEVAWLSLPERGTLLGITLVFWMATAFGRGPARLFLRLLALYYALFDRKAAAASRAWWRAVNGEAPSFRRVYEHIRRFANVTLDRIFLVKGITRPFVFTRTGHEHLIGLKLKKRGAILLGAHLGSYEALRLDGDGIDVPINIVGNFSNAKMINVLLARLSPDRTARVIHAGEDPRFIFAVKDRIEAGEVVAILGDRAAEPTVSVDFFGRKARFPAGPYQLAAVLQCPVYLTFGIYREPNEYHLSCELFAERVVLPRAERAEALAGYVQRFAKKLEEKARAAPDNWFNFFDFWEQS